MSRLPKLKVNRLPFEHASEETYDFEQARNFSYGQDSCVLVEGQEIHSYEELVQLARRDDYQDREFLNVILISLSEAIAGG